MDASKTGLRVKLPIFEQDRKQWGANKPWYTWKLEQGKSGKEGNENSCFKRSDPPFILDVLVEEGERLREKVLQEYKTRHQDNHFEEDQDLSKPWNTAKAKATQAKSNGTKGLWENLEDINSHVDEAWKGYQRAVAIYQHIPPEGSQSKEGLFERVTSSFAKTPSFRGFIFYSDDDIQTLKASLAAIKSLRFAFSVAFRDLCAIKARAAGNVATTSQFAQCFSIPNVVLRTYSHVQPTDTY